MIGHDPPLVDVKESAIPSQQAGDVTMYHNSGTSGTGWVTLCNLTGEGVLLAWWTFTSNAGSATRLRYTVDGDGGTVVDMPAQYYDGTTSRSHISIPPQIFNSSLKIELDATDASQYAITGYVI
jgi:hypothetical protein